MHGRVGGLFYEELDDRYFQDNDRTTVESVRMLKYLW